MGLPIDDYSIIMQKRSGKTDDPFVSLSETINPVNTIAILNEVPDKFTHVIIPNMYEIYEGIPSTDEFLVNYSNGNITFNVANNGNQYVATYKGTGKILVSAKRIFTEVSNKGDVTQLLSDLTDLANTATSSANTATTNANTAADNANNKATYAQTEGDYAKSVGDNVQTYWKQPVSTFSAIATTYPSPSNGWTCMTTDSNYIYRYDSSSSSWKYTQQYNDTLVTDLQNKTLGMRQSELIPSSVAIEIDGLTLGNITIPFSNIKLGTITLG